MTDDLRLLPTPPALRAWAVEIIGRDGSDPQPSDGTTLASLLPAGLVPGRGWPQRDDLVGIALSTANRLAVLGDEVVGGCGPKGAVEHGRQEIGYGFAVAYQGQGVGTAAVRLLVAELLAEPGIREVSADVLEGNVASWRLVERLGFEQVPCDLPGHRRYVLAGPDGAAMSPA